MKGEIGQKNLKVLLKIRKMRKPVFFEGRFSTKRIKELPFYEKIMNHF